LKYSRPSVKVKPPGPRARAIISRDERVVSQSNWRYLPLVIKGGSGSFIEDVDGNVFLDFNSGAATQALGIDHPEIVDALKKQADSLATYQPIPGYFYNEMVVDLCEKLAKVTPGKYEKKVSLGLSGADATDTAMKLARWHTKRKRFISFAGSNHGLGTYGALSISGYSAGTVRGFSPLVPEVTHIPFPYPYRWDGGKEPGEWVLNYLEDQVFRTTVPPDEVAGLFVEPIQGDGGVLMPPKGFLEGLQEICRRHGILFIVDEVQTGFGRTGKMFASEHWKIEPDILLLGKPLGGGTPVSACVTRSEVMDWPHGSHVITGAGHLLGCAGALTMMNLLERERIWENAANVGRYMKDRYLKMQRGYDIVGDVRGVGLLIGVEMVVSKKAKKPGLEETRRTCLDAFEKGLLTAYDGLYGNVFRITPALNITRELARAGLDIMEDAISETQRAQRV
jgi:4-aminobutyrate aminotransferase